MRLPLVLTTMTSMADIVVDSLRNNELKIVEMVAVQPGPVVPPEASNILACNVR